MYISFSLKTYPYFSLSLLLHFSPFSYLPHLVSTAFSIKFSLLPCDRAGLLNYEALHARAKRFKGFPQPHVQLQGYLATTQREKERRGRGDIRHKLAAQITSNGLHVYNVNWEKAAFRFRPKDDAQQQ